MSLIRTPYEVTPVTPGQTTDAFESFFVSGLHTVILNGGIERLLHCIYYVYITIVIIFFNITIYNRQGVCVYLVQFNYSCNSIYTYDIIFVAVNIMYVSPKDKNLQNLSVIQMSSLQVFTTAPRCAV